jgi:hypothetical protein
MTMPASISCDEFDQGVDELAVGTLGEPERGILLEHAAVCPVCEARLNGLAGLADRLLLLVPEVEPPAGFEAGAMARMSSATTERPARGAGSPAEFGNVGGAHPGAAGDANGSIANGSIADAGANGSIADGGDPDGGDPDGGDPDAGDTRRADTDTDGLVRDRRHRAPGHRAPGTTANPHAGARPAAPRKWQKRSWRLVAVAAVAVAVLGAGIALGRTSKRAQPVAVARHGEIMTVAGADVGTAQIINTPEPHVLLSLKGPLSWGVLNCQLQTAEGRRVSIGSWDYEDNPQGTWAMRIDRSLKGAVLMRIVDQRGAVVATASLA